MRYDNQGKLIIFTTMKLQYPIVNNDDQIIGYKDKEQAYKEGVMLRSIQVFCLQSQKRIVYAKTCQK